MKKKMEGGIRDGGVNGIKGRRRRRGRKELKNVKGREKLQYVRKGQEKKRKTTFNPTDSEKDEYLQRKKNSKKKKYKEGKARGGRIYVFWQREEWCR